MKKNRTYLESVHFYGRVWGYAAAVLLMVFPFALALLFGVAPDGMGTLRGFIAVAPIFWTVGVIEVFTYIPMLGAGGAYLGFVTGNLTNLKVPCVLNAMERAEVQPGTEEGEVVSTIAVAVSSLVTTLIIMLGVILIVPLTPILNSPALEPAFDNILPALFGALGVVYISKNWKISVAPVVLMLILFIFVPGVDASIVGIMVPVGAVVSIFVARLMYKRGWLGDARPASAEMIVSVPADSAQPLAETAETEAETAETDETDVETEDETDETDEPEDETQDEQN